MFARALAFLYFVVGMANAGSTTTGSSYCTLSVSKDINLEDHSFPPHPADMMGTIGWQQGLVLTNIDVYQCFLEEASKENDDTAVPEHWDDHQKTMIIFAPGAPLYLPGTNDTEPAGKEVLSAFATKLAEQGYVTVVAEKTNQLMGMSTFLPLDFLRVIEYMTNGSSWLVSENWNRGIPEFEAAVIGGHGFGGGMV